VRQLVLVSLFLVSEAWAARTLFLNRHGGDYRPAIHDDASRNEVGILTAPATMPPFAFGDARWREVVTCVARAFDRYALRLVETEPPPDEEYLEVVVGGTPAQASLTPDKGGAAGILPDCSANARGVGFAFAETIGDHPDDLCMVIVEEVGHLLGLDHVIDRCDPMTNLAGCDRELAFSDRPAPCGEKLVRDCHCGGRTQASHTLLLARVGPADHVPPVVTLVSPSDGGQVAALAPVTARASDDQKLARLELRVDGKFLGSLEGAQVTWRNIAFAPGEHTVEVTAFDKASNSAVTRVRVTAGGPAPRTAPAGGCRVVCAPVASGQLWLLLLIALVLKKMRSRAPRSSSK
jgi:hypothetical protein